MTSSMRRFAMLVAPVVLLAGCGADRNTAAPPTTATASTTTVVKETGSTELGPPARPAQLVAPDEVTAPAPLVVLLAGYGATGAVEDAYLGVSEQAASRGMYVLVPDGTVDASGKRFWDATQACCNFTGPPVDDVAYIGGLIDEAIAQRPIDPDRVYVFGHSNGGFMAYRLACERSDQVTAIAVLAGSDVADPQGCVPTQGVSVLHLHGDADSTIAYAGGSTTRPYPGAEEVVARWAGRAGCDPEPTRGSRVDLEGGIAGEETALSVYEGCDKGLAVQLDTIEGGSHIPFLERRALGTNVLDWLLERSR